MSKRFTDEQSEELMRLVRAVRRAQVEVGTATAAGDREAIRSALEADTAAYESFVAYVIGDESGASH